MNWSQHRARCSTRRLCCPLQLRRRVLKRAATLPSTHGRWGGGPCGRDRAAPHIKSYCRYSAGGEVAWLYVGSANLSQAGGFMRCRTNSEQPSLQHAGMQTGQAALASLPPLLLHLPAAAWGVVQNKWKDKKVVQGQQLKICSYELGVLLVPSPEAAYRASRWCGLSCTEGQQQQPAAPAPAAAPPTAAPPAVRFVAWQRGASQVAQANGAGMLSVPLPIPFSLPPQCYSAADQPWMGGVLWPGQDVWGHAIKPHAGRPPRAPYGTRFCYGLHEAMEWADDVRADEQQQRQQP